MKFAVQPWRLIFVLFLANLINFFDRTIPAIVKESIRHEWNLNDLQLGMITAFFTIFYGIAAVPLGYMADTGSRTKIIAWGLVGWSIFTAAGAGAWSFTSFLITRVLVAIGEAGFAPASNSIIGDLFPAGKRSLALGVFMLGLPMGLMLAFFSVGAIVSYFESWRAAFLIAMFPGLIVAGALSKIKEPNLVAAKKTQSWRPQPLLFNTIRKILMTQTMRWLIISGLAMNFAVYAVNSFIVSLLVRYYGMTLTVAAASAGVIVGLTGLAGLVGGGWVCDRAFKVSKCSRLLFGAVAVGLSSVLTWLALRLGSSQKGIFVALFSAAWLFQYLYYTSVYPAIQDVIEPKQRALAMATFLAAVSILGGAFGAVAVGNLSDFYAMEAMRAVGATEISVAHSAIGLHGAFIMVPIALAITSIAILIAALTFHREAQCMKTVMEDGSFTLRE